MNRCLAMLIVTVMWAAMMLWVAYEFYNAIPVKG